MLILHMLIVHMLIVHMLIVHMLIDSAWPESPNGSCKTKIS